MSSTRFFQTDPSASPSSIHSWEAIGRRYARTRETTLRLIGPLSPEDCSAQSMPDASPVKWHLAHTSWFFETFILESYVPRYQCYHPRYRYLFNSYYNAIGERHARPNRGLLTRPSFHEIIEYREYVDAAMAWLFRDADQETQQEIAPLIVLGCNHEQQHQELILTDIKHLLFQNPLQPEYFEEQTQAFASEMVEQIWFSFPEELRQIGHSGSTFAFDNECPKHTVFVQAFSLASRLVTNGEYLAFINAGGYTRPEHWLAEGWDAVQRERWQAPLYWTRVEDDWQQFTMRGVAPLHEAEPVAHVSYYEADAFARWKGFRLPNEAEWETVAANLPVEGNLLNLESLTPTALMRQRESVSAPAQMFGDVWEWTQSAYLAYPGYRPAAGALGEYNGKFMCNQMVLRGGSCFTPKSHIRATYRNFFHPSARWQCSGIRLAYDG